MKKIFSILLLAFIIITTLTGCMGKNESKDEALKKIRNKLSSEKIEIGKTYERIARVFEDDSYEIFKDKDSRVTIVFRNDTSGLLNQTSMHPFTYNDKEINVPGYGNYKYNFKDGLLYLTETNENAYINIYQLQEQE